MSARPETPVLRNWRPRGEGTLVGEHPIMHELHAEVARIAGTPLTVVIHGPTGAGKELVARALHAGSGRPGSFQALNVNVVTESLAESILFGVAKGAFTGATASRTGLIASAHRGTLLLDEAGDLTNALQAKLLRTIETGRLRRVGEDSEVPVDVRMVLCTQRSPAELARSGAWRGDFRYRVCGWQIRVPSLAERMSDLPLLARHFLAGRGGRVAWAEVDAELGRHDWPGNVRELQRVLGSADILAAGSVLGAEHVREARGRLGFWGGDASEAGAGAGWRRSLAQVIREHVEEVLERTGYDPAAASSILGIGRSTLYRKLANWGAARVRRAVPKWESRTDSGMRGPSVPPSRQSRQ